MLQADKTSATAFWRCYDGLILSGITPGETFTYARARALLAPLGVGRRALDQFVHFDHLIDHTAPQNPAVVGAQRAAPSTLSTDHAFVGAAACCALDALHRPRFCRGAACCALDALHRPRFCRGAACCALDALHRPRFCRGAGARAAPSTPNQITPAPSTPPPVDTAWQASNLIEQNAFVPTTKRSQLKRGKKPTLYTLPDLDTLCQRLGVLRTPGDPITAADVRTPTTYRASLEREFIRRRPGRYSLGLLAARLGVTPRSIQRYHTAEAVEQRSDLRHLGADHAAQPRRHSLLPRERAVQVLP